MEFTYALRFKFDAPNNEAEFKAIVAGLRIAKQMAKEQSMIQYLEKVKTLINGFKKFSIEQLQRNENKKADALSKITSTSFAYLTKQVLVENSYRQKNMLGVSEGEEIVTLKLLMKKMEDFSQERDWEKYHSLRNLLLALTNEQVERANHSLGEGITARLGEGNKTWIEEVSHILWAHRTMIKTSNGDTPFSLTYSTEAVIPVEIGMPSLRCAKVDQIMNDEALLLNLDILEERRERAIIREAKSKVMCRCLEVGSIRRIQGLDTAYWGFLGVGTTLDIFQNIIFIPYFEYDVLSLSGYDVLSLIPLWSLVSAGTDTNEAIHAKESEKLGLKWEIPYEVVTALGKGAYKIRNRNGDIPPRT
ncbi:reverse transcriptase domain-containing protein [Tanacetum coccineum]